MSQTCGANIDCRADWHGDPCEFVFQLDVTQRCHCYVNELNSLCEGLWWRNSFTWRELADEFFEVEKTDAERFPFDTGWRMTWAKVFDS